MVFVANEVKDVISHAVTDSNKEYIPNHYNNCLVDNTSNIHTSNVHNFIEGDNVKFYDTLNTELFYDIVNVIDSNHFTISESIEKKELFCFGKQVSDFNI